MTRSRFASSLAFAPALGLSLLGAACAPEDATEIVAAVQTQLQVPYELTTVGVAVQSGGRLVHCLYYPVDDGTVSLPSTLGMEPSDDPSIPVTVTVLGFREEPPPQSWDCLSGIPEMGKDQEVSVLRRRRMPYAEKRTVLLPMALKHACVDLDPPCTDGETCIGGQCQADAIDPVSLLDYSETLVYGTANTCFSVSECTASWNLMPALTVDAASCTFEAAGQPGFTLPDVGLNVVLLHDDMTPEVLDLDPLEGFTIPDPSSPHRFQLAQSLCQSRFAHGQINAVMASTACAAKTPYQPICAADQAAILRGTSPLPGQRVCNASVPLEAAASALYVVMDRSAAMGSYFGDAGLEQVLSLSLQDPVFANTLVAFKFAPADELQCNNGPNSYATLDGATDVPFTLARDAQPLVAAQVSDAANVLATNPPVDWDVVLQSTGAYQALANLSPPGATSFNQRAVMLVGNRDFYETCTDPMSPLTDLAAAGTQLATPARTYTVVLEADAGVDQGGHDPAADAAAVALAGDGRSFDATTDPSAGATALLTIASDLGTCLYDPPGGATLSTAAAITYFDPVWLTQNSIPFDAACLDDTSVVSGWNNVGDHVRICGFACSDLRNTLQILSASAAGLGLSAPVVPLRASLPCP